MNQAGMNLAYVRIFGNTDSVSAREQWKLRGRVRTCRIQRTWFARQCGAEACETEERCDGADLEFHEDGTLSRQSHTNPDSSEWVIKYEYGYRSGQLTAVRQIREDSATVCTNEYDGRGRLCRIIDHSAGAGRTMEKYDYDEAGSKKKTQYVDLANQRPDTLHAWGVQGTDTCYSAPDTAKLTTLYNERDQPVELLFHDASDQLVSRVVFTYDAGGNLIEELQTRAEGAFVNLFKDVSPDQLDSLRAMFQSASEPTRIKHRYDHDGRRVETHLRFGLLSDQFKTRSYNEYGEEILETSEEHSRDYGPNAEGQLSPVPASERVGRSETRFGYEYDEYENWTMKTIEGRSSIDEEFSIFSIEKRTIGYF
jgi:hypothetical protein